MRSAAIAMTSLRGLGPLPDLVRSAAGEGVLDRLFQLHNLPVGLDVRQGMVRLATMIDLFESAARLTGDDRLGLRVGQSMRPQDFGPWVAYSADAATLREGLKRLCRTVRLHQSGASLAIEPAGSHLRLTYRTGESPSLHCRQHADHSLLPMIQFLRRFAGPEWVPIAVEVPYPNGPWRHDVEAAAKAPVRFDLDAIAVVFERSLLDRKATTGNPHKPLTLADVRVMMAARPPRTMAETVLATLQLRLLDGQCDIDGTSASLGLGQRSLQRRLAQEGTTYRALVDLARHRRADGLLRESPLSVTQIALDLGYEDPAHFTRAFQRWAGTSPSQWRRSSGAGTADIAMATVGTA